VIGSNRLFCRVEIADKLSGCFDNCVAVRRVLVYKEMLNLGRREFLWFFIFQQGVNQA